jgi:hypothetical protein
MLTVASPLVISSDIDGPGHKPNFRPLQILGQLYP